LSKDFRQIRILSIQNSRLHNTKEVFIHCIIKTVALTQHALYDMMFGKTLAVAEVLALLIPFRVKDKGSKVIESHKNLVEHVVMKGNKKSHSNGRFHEINSKNIPPFPIYHYLCNRKTIL